MTDTTSPLASAEAASPARNLDGVIRETLMVARRNAGAVILASALFGAAPAALQTWVLLQAAHLPMDAPFRYVGVPAVSWLIAIAAATLIQTVLATVTLGDQRNQRIGFGEALAQAAPRLPAQLVIALIVTLATGFGAVLLVVPGIIAALAFSVAAPAGLDERLSPMDALRRSGRMTRGWRAGIFALFLCYLLALALVEGPLILFSGAGLRFFTDPLAPQRMYVLSVAALLTRWVTPVGATIIYLRLRDITGTHASSDLAKVFD